MYLLLCFFALLGFFGRQMFFFHEQSVFFRNYRMGALVVNCADHWWVCFTPLFSHAAWYFCSDELLRHSVECICFRYPNLER